MDPKLAKALAKREKAKSAKAVKKQEKVVKEMGFDLEPKDRLEIEMMVRTQYCGFQAKLKCKGSPAANMLKK